MRGASGGQEDWVGGKEAGARVYWTGALDTAFLVGTMLLVSVSVRSNRSGSPDAGAAAKSVQLQTMIVLHDTPCAWLDCRSKPPPPPQKTRRPLCWRRPRFSLRPRRRCPSRCHFPPPTCIRHHPICCHRAPSAPDPLPAAFLHPHHPHHGHRHGVPHSGQARRLAAAVLLAHAHHHPPRRRGGRHPHRRAGAPRRGGRTVRDARVRAV